MDRVLEERLEEARELPSSFGLCYLQTRLIACEILSHNLCTRDTVVPERCGLNVNSRSNESFDTSLHSAATSGDLEIVKMLLYEGAYIDEKNEYGRTPLYNAIEYKKVEIMQLLLKNKADLNVKDFDGTCPLHVAVKTGCPKIVKLILQKGVNINAKDLMGRTPFYCAIINKQILVARLLIKHRANVNESDNDFSSPLHVAVETGCLQSVELLLNCGAYVNCASTSTRKKGYAPLHLAVENGNREVVRLLLSSDANVDVKADNSITPLHIAAKKGSVHIAKDLLDHGASIHAITSQEGYTPLHIATKIGSEIVVKLLLQHGGEVDNQDKDGKTILHFAVERGDLMIVKDVLQYCPDINNDVNKRSFNTAVQGHGRENNKIVEALLQYGFNVNREDANNRMLLHAAVECGFVKIVENLLKYGADVNILRNAPCKDGCTLLHTATINRQDEVASLLIKYGADVNARNKFGKTPIYYATENADLKIAALLLTNGAIVKDDREMLSIAVEKECVEIVKGLLEHDADINATDSYGRTPLHFIAVNRSEIDIGLCIYNNMHPNDDINVKGEIAKLLLSKGANVDAQTKSGVTTLHAAICKRYTKVVEILLEYGANVNSVVRGTTLLHFSAKNGSDEICSVLLSKGANVNDCDKDGMTALHIATLNGHLEAVKVLLQCGAKFDSKDKHGITPLYLGAQNSDKEIVETILKFGADVNARNQFGRTALHIASEKGRVEVVETLLEYGADVNITCGNCQTSLDYAMAGIRSFFDLTDPDCYYAYPAREISLNEITADILKCHLVKMETANLYVSEKNLLSMNNIYTRIENLKQKCEKEIAIMKSEKINNTNISFYDILAKSSSSLAIHMRDENVVNALKSDDYKMKFPRYASMIQSNFRKGLERKELLEHEHEILFNNFMELPYDCIEKILSYLRNEDLRIFIVACKPLNIRSSSSDIDININDAVDTSNIYRVQ